MRFIKIQAVMLFHILCAACGMPPDLPEKSAIHSVIMPSQKVFNGKQIQLCFTGERVPEAEDLLRSLVEREFHAKTSLRFLGFKACTKEELSSTSIRVEFTSGPITCGQYTDSSILGCSFIGPTVRSLEKSHNASIVVRVPEDDPEDWSGRQVRRVNNSTLHELGHAVGLMHEHERTDSQTAQQCRSTFQVNSTLQNGTGRVLYVGSFDPGSIMSYCNGEAGVLSPGDVRGLAQLYSTGGG